MALSGATQAALRGEPSYVWRAGQERRLRMILDSGPSPHPERVLVDGCGLGLYVRALEPHAPGTVGLDIEWERVARGVRSGIGRLLVGDGQRLPFPSGAFDLVLSNEVIEHVADDRKAVLEMVRVLRPLGRLVLFCPNRWYPFETHGIYWRGRYHFGNIPLVNYLPRFLRDRLAPHVRAYTQADLRRLFQDLPVQVLRQTVIFGGYDNLLARRPRLGRALRSILQSLERTPLRHLGLSHWWVIERQ
ncbi:MAG: methyltransferase domain-containing protein [Anaerolineales bacterium]